MLPSMRLMLLRHASSRKAEPGMHDLDRALNTRGRNDAAKIGAYMAHHALLPDRVIVSPARRARETWEHVSKAFSALPPVDHDNRLYEGGPDAILTVVRETSPSIRCLLIIGHNPGLHETARLLMATGDVERRERLNEGLPTAGLALIDFPVDDWRKVHPRGGRLALFVSPRSLEV
jgi:phosphohistidine phosphatase